MLHSRRAHFRGPFLHCSVEVVRFRRRVSWQRTPLKVNTTSRLGVIIMSAGATSDATLSDLWQEFNEKQKNVAKLTIPELTRSFAQNSKFASFVGVDRRQTEIVLFRVGVLSVLTQDKASEGFPVGSVVNYAADEDGKPIFCLSDLAAHTRALKNDSRASLLIPETENLVTIPTRG